MTNEVKGLGSVFQAGKISPHMGKLLLLFANYYTKNRYWNKTKRFRRQSRTTIVAQTLCGIFWILGIFWRHHELYTSFVLHIYVNIMWHYIWKYYVSIHIKTMFLFTSFEFICINTHTSFYISDFISTSCPSVRTFAGVKHIYFITFITTQ